MSRELTDDEAKWIKKLNRVLSQCPSERLGFYTVGDASIEIYDLNMQGEIDALMDRKGRDLGPAAEEVDAKLSRLKFPSNVHSTAG